MVGIPASLCRDCSKCSVFVPPVYEVDMVSTPLLTAGDVPSEVRRSPIPALGSLRPSERACQKVGGVVGHGAGGLMGRHAAVGPRLGRPL